MTIFTSRLFTVYMSLCALVIALLTWPSLFRRKWAMKTAKLWTGSVEWGLRTFYGIDHRILGAENLPDGPSIIAAKHQSMWETVALARYLPSPSFVLKKELRNVPIFGWWCWRAGFIFVDREAGAKALKDMVEKSKHAFAQGTSHILIFPEGTRTRVGHKATYHPGVAALAKALSLPVVPAAHNSGCFWRHPSGEKLAGTITLEFFPAIAAGTPRPEMMRRIEETVETGTTRLVTDAERQTGRQYTPPSPEVSHDHA